MKLTITAAVLALTAVSNASWAKDLSDMVNLGTQQRAANEYLRDPCEEFRKADVYVGMNDTQALCTWGRPDKVNRTRTRYGSSEQWVYRATGRYLYLENRRVTSIQD